jgi:diaminohydroxyphosphoribosylaminopyrimidine deaminase/5-amino-6-(5-phosphoribosylamino)uracil reductase
MSDERDHEDYMRVAIAEAERARGSTGDNPWVGCVLVDARGEVVARGHTQGPGEDHAEIVAMNAARAAGIELAATTLYSTLEPCAFHGRTPACAHAIIAAGVRRVVTGILDPNPRVDGEGLRILERAGVQVIPDVGALAIRHQLAPWILRYHPHELERRSRSLVAELGDRTATVLALTELYGIERAIAEAIVDRALLDGH